MIHLTFKSNRFSMFILWPVVLVLLLGGCRKAAYRATDSEASETELLSPTDNGTSDADADADTDTDADTDADADADTDADTDADADADTDADTDADADADTDADTDADADADTDADADADTDADADADADADTGGDSDTNTDTVADTDFETDTQIVVSLSHRPEAVSCDGQFSPPEPEAPDLVESTCIQHADCRNGHNGKCLLSGWPDIYGCEYDECLIDEECDPQMVCYCDGQAVSRCLHEGNCRTDADCGENKYCSPTGVKRSGLYNGMKINGYYCRTPDDTCAGDTDCDEQEYCAFDIYNGYWACQPVIIIVG